MKIKGILIFVLFLTFASCRDEVAGTKQPDDLIPTDTMVMVLKDLTLIESHIQMKYLQVTTYKETMKRSGQVIMDKYRISRERFESSMDYYGTRQLEMQDIYARVLDSLNLMSGKIVLEKERGDRSVEPRTDSMPHLPGFINRKKFKMD
jgi:hypothetical protein